MSIEIDHVILFTRDPERDAAALREVGLIEGSPNSHPGQGTACRRFFFRNAYIELLYLVNEIEARSALTAPTRLWERLCGGSGVCPFGIAFRSGQESGSFPIPHWDYHPRYLRADLQIEVGTNCDRLDEPLLINLPFATRPDAASPERRQALTHNANIGELTFLLVSGPWSASEVMAAIDRYTPALAMSDGEYLIQLAFDHGGSGEVLDLRPQMPLVLALGQQ